VQVADLLTYAQESLVIAEGSVFLPHLVAPLLTTPHQAIWLFPTEQFKARSFHERGKDRYSAREKNSNPALATANFYGSSGIQGGDMGPSRKRQKFVGLSRTVAPLPGRVIP